MNYKHENVADGARQAESAIAPFESTSTEQGERSAQILRSLIKTRAMLQETRNRSAELRCALELFKYRQAKVANG